jgi:hypothetical protein
MVQYVSGEKYTMERLVNCILTQIFSVNKIEKNEVGNACSFYGCLDRFYRFLVGKLEGNFPFGKFRRRLLLSRIFRK